MESAPILACQRWLRTNRCPVCCGLREAVAADPGTMPSSSVCSVSHTCLPGPVHTHTPSLCPRQSHPISTSSMWSSRCGNSVLLQCRQRCVHAPPSYPPRPPSGHGEASVFSLLSDHSPQQEQYRFLYHTVAQLFSRTLQNTSPHHQKLKEVRGAPNFTLSATNTLNTPENSNGLTVPGPWPPQDCFLRLSPHKVISALTVTSMTSRPSPPALL